MCSSKKRKWTKTVGCYATAVILARSAAISAQSLTFKLFASRFLCSARPLPVTILMKEESHLQQQPKSIPETICVSGSHCLTLWPVLTHETMITWETLKLSWTSAATSSAASSSALGCGSINGGGRMRIFWKKTTLNQRANKADAWLVMRAFGATAWHLTGWLETSVSTYRQTGLQREATLKL